MAQIAVTTGSEWGLTERFVSGSALKNQCNKTVCRCAVCSMFEHRRHSRAARNTAIRKTKYKKSVDFIGSPSKGLAIMLLLQRRDEVEELLDQPSNVIVQLVPEFVRNRQVSGALRVHQQMALF